MESNGLLRRMPLRSFEIHGISSMMRGLDWLADDVPALEAAILTTQRMDHRLREELEVRSGDELIARVGDVVLFRVLEPGPFPDMETTWGGRVDIVSGRIYVGVICERNSTKYFAASFGEKRCSYNKLVLQWIAQSGGIGYCTGCSPALSEQTGYGRPADVEVIGILYDSSRQTYLNTISISGLDSSDPQPQVEISPVLLVLGTTTDVGKTTVACRLLQELSQKVTCAAIKASGTEWVQDSLLHTNSGAAWGMNFGFVGLPTTYSIDAALYKRAITRLYHYLDDPRRIPRYKRPPADRYEPWPRPDMVLIEHGGDILGASVPVFLDDDYLTEPVRMIIVCSESALAMIGALKELSARRIGTRRHRLYAAMPRINPEGFIDRMTPHVESGHLHGIVDINKPNTEPVHGWRCEYANRHHQVLSAGDLVMEMESILDEERRSRSRV
ncbi:MAG: hypothetical protein WCC87_21835 [Candidatus Korobacteraceae bacterium]